MNFLPEYSNFVKGVDAAFLFILGIAFLFLIGLTITMIVFVIKYRKTKHPKPVQMKDNYTLEVIWTVVPLILVLLMFYFGYVGFMPMRNAPDNAMVIKTTGRMWEWEFEYPNGKISKDLYIPVNTPIKLALHSDDVIHSLYIPSFRVKEDVVPGQETYMWFIPELKGTFEILCAEYCGLRHSYMESKAFVIDSSAFTTWLADYTKPAPSSNEGLAIIKKNACTGCHSLDGTRIVGPSFKNMFNSKRTVLIDDKPVTKVADEAFIKLSILDPNSEILEGYPANLMQPYKGVISDEDIDKVIEYLKTLE